KRNGIDIKRHTQNGTGSLNFKGCMIKILGVGGLKHHSADRDLFGFRGAPVHGERQGIAHLRFTLVRIRGSPSFFVGGSITVLMYSMRALIKENLGKRELSISTVAGVPSLKPLVKAR